MTKTTDLVHLNLPVKLIAKIDKLAEEQRRTRTAQIILMLEEDIGRRYNGN